MANRVQSLRSSTAGARPTGRTPGELYTNWPDMQFGVVNASNAATDLLAVRFFSTLASYAIGDHVLQGGFVYRATGASSPGAFAPANWSKLGTMQDLANYLALAGGTLTGALILAADPSAALGAATKQYVDTGVAAANANAAAKVPLAGGTMTGALILSGPPSAANQAATKAYVDSGAFLPLAGGTLTGPLTLAADPTVALGAATMQYADTKLAKVGVTDGSNAAAGQIGEVISATVTTGVGLGTSATSTIVAITLTPGDWDVTGEVWFTVGTGCTAISATIGQVSGTPPGAPTISGARNQINLSAGTINAGLQIMPLKISRFSVSVSTPVYLMALCNFTGGTTTATGAIWARRAR